MKRRWFVGMTCNRGTIVDGPYPGPNPNDGYHNRRWLVECRCGRRDVVPQSCLSQHGKCVDCRSKKPKTKWRTVYGKTLQEMADERGIASTTVLRRILKNGHPGPVEVTR